MEQSKDTNISLAQIIKVQWLSFKKQNLVTDYKLHSSEGILDPKKCFMPKIFLKNSECSKDKSIKKLNKSKNNKKLKLNNKNHNKKHNRNQNKKLHKVYSQSKSVVNTRSNMTPMHILTVLRNLKKLWWNLQVLMRYGLKLTIWIKFKAFHFQIAESVIQGQRDI